MSSSRSRLPLYITFVVTSIVLLGMSLMMVGRQYKTTEFSLKSGKASLTHLFDRDAKDASQGVEHIVTVRAEGEAPLSLSIEYRQKGGEWQSRPMHRAGDTPLYAASLPALEKPGRWFYRFRAAYPEGVEHLWVKDESTNFYVTYEGHVPLPLLVFHVFLMIVAAILFFHVFHYCLEVIINRTNITKAWWSGFLGWVTFSISAFALGPFVTNRAFGPPNFAPWPFGGDITDTKSFYLALVWLIPLFMRRDALSGKEHTGKLSDRGFAWFCFIALIVSLIVFMIPHSLFVQAE